MIADAAINQTRNLEFEAWRDSLPEKHWAKYDLSACRLGWEAALGLMPYGVSRILNERVRQLRVEGYSPEHDDKHDSEELVEAAACYAVVASATARGSSAREWPAHMFDGLSSPCVEWPWAEQYWKPSDDPIRNLEKAGALIAAEIERLVRLQKKEESA